MKQITKFLFLLLLITIIGCSNDNVEYSCIKNTIRILNKTKQPCGRGAGDCYHHAFYLYDGTKSYWCSTDRDTYNSYNINDTLPTLAITKTIYETNNKQNNP